MPLLTSVGVTCINTEELERMARAESTSARAICAALVPERAPPSRRAAASFDPLPDYRVMTVERLEQRARETSEPISMILGKIAAEAKAVGVGSVVFPTTVRPGLGDVDVITVPAFVKEAHSVSPLTEPPTDAERVLDGNALLRSIGQATAWMRPHLDGFEIAAAKAARALQVGPISSALDGDDPRHDALREFISGLAIAIALRTNHRVGGGDSIQTSVLTLALHQLLAERLDRPKSEDDSPSRLFDTASRSAAHRMSSHRTRARAAYFDVLDRLVPLKQAEFVCPSDELIEEAVSACLQISLEHSRLTRERAALGLKDERADA
jgi:hypothetical protein